MRRAGADDCTQFGGNLLPAAGEAGYERALEKVKAVRELREDSQFRKIISTVPSC